MKLLHVMPTYLPAVRYGGPMYAVHSLCRSLVARGHEVQVCTTNIDGPGELDVPVGVPVARDGVQVRYFHSGGPRRLAHSGGMRDYLRGALRDTDLVHTHSVFMWPPWHAAKRARTSGAPYVMTPRGMLVPELLALRNRVVKMLWLRLLESPNLAAADALHFTSDLERTEAARLGIPVGRAAVIANGIDLEEARGAGNGALQLPADFVLHLGRISWKKGLDRLIRALPQAGAVHAVIAGHDEEGCRASLERLARECGVADRVRFLDPVHGAAKWSLLRAARALVLPSYSENFGNAVLESMAVGRPVVVSPGVGLAAAVRGADCGIVVEPEPGALADALQKLWRDDALCSTLGERGRALVEREYAWPRIAAQVEALYLSILERRGKRAARS